MLSFFCRIYLGEKREIPFDHEGKGPPPTDKQELRGFMWACVIAPVACKELRKPDTPAASFSGSNVNP